MRVIKFEMNCGYVGTDEEEIMEFPDDFSDEEIDSEVEEWFWDKFHGSFSWEEV